ncbi:PfkB family carbohydrate kinase [Thioalkalivibrio sp. ALR17-21]|uniref:PfkB family carbohydrate kinase n=1 Tax=Thioalkalivibrio sp. ALR17-21 TaxID=1269813 RepID=UPI00040938E8|nr:PfkB family carbohydrate kinase [Thioalkalivibrio sp. ALR17-21]
MARILMTGIVTLDHVLDVDTYPAEDAEVRADASRTRPGGNAANTAALLAQFGHRPELAAVVAEGAAGDDLIRRLRERRIHDRHLVRRPGATPTSHILRARDTGSRTIVHHRDLPELAVEDLNGVAWEEYDWLHFEGRNPEVLARVLATVRDCVYDAPVSLELEKPRDGLEACIPFADILMVSRDWARARAERTGAGGDTAATCEAALRALMEEHPEAIITVTGGPAGAWIGFRGRVEHCAPTPGLTVIDSVGAGDAFNAGLIDAIASGEPPERALVAAVRLAERKLAQDGFDGLVRD